MSEIMSMTRQQLLKRGGLAGLGLVVGGTLLEACGGGSKTAATVSEGVSPAAAERRLATASGTVKGLFWEGYEPTKLPAGVNVSATPMAAIEDPINKKGTYDVGVNVSGLFPQQELAGAMSPLNLDLLPSLSECVSYAGLVDSNGVPKFATIDGTAYGAGYLWSPFVVTYLKGVVKPVENLEALLEPEYRGKFGIGDDATSAIMMVASCLGLGGDQPGHLTKSEFDQVFAKLEEFKEAAKGFITNPYGEYASQYGRGEIVAAFPDYSGTVSTAQRSGVNVGESLPKGSFSYADTWFLGSAASGSDADYAFIDSGIQEATQLKLGMLFTSGVFNAKAMDKISAKIDLYRDPEQLLSKAPMREWPPLESNQFVTYGEWSKRWQELKA